MNYTEKNLDFYDLRPYINADHNYLALLKDIMQNGTLKENRTGIDTISISGAMIKHDMSVGFPLITTKAVAKKTMATELEFFLKGYTSKDWLQNRNCKIWNEWCNPKLIPDGLTDTERKDFQFNEIDLGPVYGSQWRNFNNAGYDQVANVLTTLAINPDDRRMIVSAWNPLQLDEMALPPCHLMWHVIKRGKYLDLIWYQRSVDTFLGLPFNIASYGLLLELLADQFGFEAGVLTGMLGDTHLYVNHLKQVEEQLTRNPFSPPELKINSSFKDVRNFVAAKDIEFIGYEHHPAIKAPIAI